MKQAVPPGPCSNITKRYFANRVRFFDEVRRDYGPLIYFRIGFLRVYLVTDPADVRAVMTDRGMRKSWITKLLLWPVVGNGLLLSEGELYKRQRRLIQPAFHRKRVEVYGRVAVESALEWSQARTHGQPVEMGDEMMGLTLDIVGRSLFGSEMGEQARHMGQVRKTTMRTPINNSLVKISQPKVEAVRALRLNPT